MTGAVAATWGIAALATGGVIARPWRLPEAIWAVAGALALIGAGLMSPAAAWRGVARGTDVYLFLVGMMLLAELARQEGVFDWLAARAARLAAGSAARLFTLVYAVGVIVTVFLSNDATAVVLTPAVAAAARAARVATPLPALLACAFVANAASFVLPISNPANLVIYGRAMPPLLDWLGLFALPSALAIAATYAALRLSQRQALRETLAGAPAAAEPLGAGGRVAGLAIAGMAVVLLVASGLGLPLGAPTCGAGVLAAAIVLARTRRSPWPLLRGVAWGVLPLVAGLFVLVEALEGTGLLTSLAAALRDAAGRDPQRTAWATGIGTALLCNLVNNLPAGLLAGSAVQAAHAPAAVTGAVLVGIDLGPNLSVTGSLATILWLAALRREQLAVGTWAFLRLGLVVMPPALLLALAALLWQP